MDLLSDLQDVRDGKWGELPLPAIAKLNEMCIQLGEFKQELEQRGLKMPPELTESLDPVGSESMVKNLIFGRGDITSRLVLHRWYCRLEFKLADLWIGAFWKRIGHCLDIWICLLPCLPIHFCFMWHDPEQ